MRRFAVVYDELLSPEQKKRSDALRDDTKDVLHSVRSKMEANKLQLKEALDDIMATIGKANKYIEESAPWEYAKADNMEAIKLIMADLLEVLRRAAIGMTAFMPETAQKMWNQLGLKGKIEESIGKEELSLGDEDVSLWRKFPEGTKVAKGDPLFPRIQ